MKKIFPEMIRRRRGRARCRERGITFTEVEQRLELTEEDVVLGQVTRTCMEAIDRCRPYFNGITGDRHGFSPTHHEILKDLELLQLSPWIEGVAADGVRITETDCESSELEHCTALLSSIQSREYEPWIWELHAAETAQ